MRSGPWHNSVLHHPVDESGNMFRRNRVLFIYEYERFERFSAQAISSVLSGVAAFGRLVQERRKLPERPKRFQTFIAITQIGANPCIVNQKKIGPSA